MKLSTRAQYGTLLMLNLALKYGKGPVLLKDIAQAEGISEKYLSQIIIPLKSAGLVKSFRGPHGGYVLAHPMKEISMKDVVEVLEGAADLVGYQKNVNRNDRVTVAVTRKVWNQLGDAMTQMLASVTLADMVTQCAERQETALMYNI